MQNKWKIEKAKMKKKRFFSEKICVCRIIVVSLQA